MKKKLFYVYGMHCSSCERILEDEIMQVSNVLRVRIDRKEDSVEVEYKDSLDVKGIQKVVEKSGYKFFDNKKDLDVANLSEREPKNLVEDWIKALAVVFILLGGYYYLSGKGFFDGIGVDDSRMSWGVAFLIGLVASVSSCLAVVGSVVIAFGEKFKSKSESFYGASIRPHLLFHVGRISSFFLFGGLLGVVGGKIDLSFGATGFFMMILGVVMALLGMSILFEMPRLSSFGLRLPGFIIKKWNRLRGDNRLATPFWLGLLSFFLPCGFTQSMQIFALTTGNFWLGGSILASFALGTMPVLMVIGATTTWMKSKKIIVFQKVAGLFVVIFAFLTFQSGLALQDSQASKNDSEIGSLNQDDDSGGQASSQTVEMKISGNRFLPSEIRIKKDVPVEWIIIGEKVTGCTNKIIVPSLNISQDIKDGRNIVRFTPREKGSIPFSCWMGMVRGRFVVE